MTGADRLVLSVAAAVLLGLGGWSGSKLVSMGETVSNHTQALEMINEHLNSIDVILGDMNKLIMERGRQRDKENAELRTQYELLAARLSTTETAFAVTTAKFASTYRDLETYLCRERSPLCHPEP